MSPADPGGPQRRCAWPNSSGLGQSLRRKACPENLRGLAFELWREESFQSYRFGKITVEINPMHQEK